jgi:hypothetical protein
MPSWCQVSDPARLYLKLSSLARFLRGGSAVLWVNDSVKNSRSPAPQTNLASHQALRGGARDDRPEMKFYLAGAYYSIPAH